MKPADPALHNIIISGPHAVWNQRKRTYVKQTIVESQDAGGYTLATAYFSDLKAATAYAKQLVDGRAGLPIQTIDRTAEYEAAARAERSGSWQ